MEDKQHPPTHLIIKNNQKPLFPYLKKFDCTCLTYGFITRIYEISYFRLNTSALLFKKLRNFSVNKGRPDRAEVKTNFLVRKDKVIQPDSFCNFSFNEIYKNIFRIDIRLVSSIFFDL